MKSFKTLFGFLYISLSMLYPINGHGALIDELTDGQHIISMRHADAPGFGDPPGYRLDQCSTQRNLEESKLHTSSKQYEL